MEKDAITIICYNVIKGGGPPIVSDFLNYALAQNIDVVLLCPKTDVYLEMVKQAQIKRPKADFVIKYFPVFLNSIFLKPVINYLYLPMFVSFAKGNRVYNLGNVAFPSVKRQFLLMHNAFAVSKDKELYSRFPVKARFKQKLMNYFIRVNLKFADVVAVQTQTIKHKIDLLLNKESLVIANVTQNQQAYLNSYRLPQPQRIKFLFLSKYYTHKNFEILIPLAKRIKELNLPYTISITFDEANPEEMRFLNLLSAENLNKVIENIGYISPDKIADTYHNHDALFLPSLMESFSGTYTEAMCFGKPIFTSDRDFAHEVCDKGAVYFDPLSVDDILEKFDVAFNDVPSISDTVALNQDKLNRILKEKESMSKLILQSLSL